MKSLVISISLAFWLLLAVSCGPRLPEATKPAQGSGGGQLAASPLPAGSAASLELQSSSLDAAPPSDIRDEVFYFGGLGGPQDCSTQNYHTPTILRGDSVDIPQLAETLVIYACGLPVIGENVSVRVVRPDSAIAQSTVMTNQYSPEKLGQAVLYYTLKLDDPVGTYHFTFQGAGWSLDGDFSVPGISRPSLILSNNQLFFLKFQPHENIRLFVYVAHDPFVRLLGWREVQADDNGQVTVITDITKGFYAAIGDLSGTVYFRTADGQGGWFGHPITK